MKKTKQANKITTAEKIKKFNKMHKTDLIAKFSQKLINSPNKQAKVIIRSKLIDEGKLM